MLDRCDRNAVPAKGPLKNMYVTTYQVCKFFAINCFFRMILLIFQLNTEKILVIRLVSNMNVTLSQLQGLV